VLARRSFAIGLLLALTLPALAFGSTCSCPRMQAARACCRSSAASPSLSAPRGCCSAAVPASGPDANLPASALSSSTPEPTRSAAAQETERALRPSTLQAAMFLHPEATETPPDLPIRNRVLLI